VVKLRGRLAYVPQQAFLQNGTVKDNIIFGHPPDEEKYGERGGGGVCVFGL
jgi:ABC-type multidrug transport system fused ATPase/permease subunit